MSNVCQDKLEFENPRRNPYILAAPHLPLTEHNFFLTEQNLPLTEHCKLFNSIHMNKPTCLGANFVTNTLGLSTKLYAKEGFKAS